MSPAETSRKRIVTRDRTELVSIKIFERTRDWLDEQKIKLKRATRTKSTMAEVVEMLVLAYEASTGTAIEDTSEPGLTHAEQRYADRLLKILRSGQRDALKTLDTAMEIGELLIEVMPPKKRNGH